VNPKELLRLLDRPIAYHRIFAEIGGSVAAGIFLSQAVYWSQRTADKNGWFWKTQAQWFEETYLKRADQEKARRELRAVGVLEEIKKGTPAKLYFRINLETLANRLLSPGCQDAANLDAKMQHAENLDAKFAQTRMSDSAQPSLRESDILYIETETTTEISSETLKPPLPPRAAKPVENLGQQKIPPEPPQGGEGCFLNSQEETAKQPDRATATTISETKPNPVLNSNGNDRGQNSASRREPKSIRNVRRHYGEALPPWRSGWGVGEYTPAILQSAKNYLAKLPPSSAQAYYTPVQLLEESEEKERWASLEDRSHQPGSPRSPQLGQTASAPVDLGDTIAQIDTYLNILGWSRKNAIEHLIELGKFSVALRNLLYEGQSCNFGRLDDFEVATVRDALIAQIKARNAPQSESDDKSYERSG
jgi:hypothetical protein